MSAADHGDGRAGERQDHARRAPRGAARLGLVHTELDSLFHVTHLGSATDEEFRAGLVARMDAAPQGWVTCGNYVTKSKNLHIERADTLVFLDQGRVRTTWRVAKRTIRRFVRREELFGNGIREPINNFWRWDPARNVIRWTWVYHPKYRRETLQHIASEAWSHLDVHHFTRPADVAEFVEGLPPADR